MQLSPSLLPDALLEALWHPVGRIGIGLVCAATSLVIFLLSCERMARSHRRAHDFSGTRSEIGHGKPESTAPVMSVGPAIMAATLVAFVAWQSFAHGVVATIPLSAGTGTANWTDDLWLIPALSLMFLGTGLLGFVYDRAIARRDVSVPTCRLYGWQFLICICFLVYAREIALKMHLLSPVVNAKVFREPGIAEAGDYRTVLLGVLLCAIMVATINAVACSGDATRLTAGLAVQFGVVMMLVGSIVMDGWWDSDLLWACLLGACAGLAFLRKQPVPIVIGNAGLFALGSAIGGAAILLRVVWLLPFIAFVFYVEALSVVLQACWFRWTCRRTGTGRRLFREVPLHRHFIANGWNGTRVVVTFWCVNLTSSIVGLIFWHNGVLPRLP